MKKNSEEIVSIYLLKKYSFNELTGESELCLKVGHTSKEDFIRELNSGKYARSDSYNTCNAPEPIGYELLGIVKAPRILENMFHIKYNNLRIINKRTNRKFEWMLYSESIVEDFFSSYVFENMCEFLENNKDIYLTGSKNLFVKTKIIKFLEKKKKEDFKYLGEKLENILRASIIPKENLYINERKNKICNLLSDEIKNGMDLL